MTDASPHSSSNDARIRKRGRDLIPAVVSIAPIFLNNLEAARSLGISEDTLDLCAQAYDYKPSVRGHKISLWRPQKLLLLANAIEKNGIPKRERPPDDD